MRELKVLHPDLTPEERRELLFQGVERFNGRDFYGAHDAWEEVWRSTRPEPKGLLQGLIQAAAALHQLFDLKREAGPRGTLAKALRNLEGHRPEGLGLAIEELVRELESVRAWLEDPSRAEGSAPVPRLVLRDRAALV